MYEFFVILGGGGGIKELKFNLKIEYLLRSLFDI